MADLLSLPVELQLAITAHLPLYSNSIRPSSCLVSLSRTCRHFHSVLTPFVNHKIRVANQSQAEQYLRAPRQVHRHVGNVVFDRGGGNNRGWHGAIQLVRDVLDTTSGLHELRLDLDGSHLDDSSETTLWDSLLRLRTSLRSLELNVTSRAGSRQYSAAHAATAATAAAASLDEPHEFGFIPFSPGPRRKIALGSLFAFEQLQHVKLSNVELSDLLPWAASVETNWPRLESLELSRCTVRDGALSELARRSQGTLKTFVLQECEGFTRTTVERVVNLVGSNLETLEISGSPFLAPPGHSFPLETQLDLFACLPRLRYLTLSGPLLSTAALHSLPRHCPHLRSISLSSNPDIILRQLLPLLSSTALPYLGTLSFTPFSAPLNPSLPTVESPSFCTSLNRSPSSSPHSSSSPRFSPSRIFRSESSHLVNRTMSRTTGGGNLHEPSVSPNRPDDDDEERDTKADSEESVLVELASLALSHEVELVGDVFEPIRGKLEWALRESSKRGSQEPGPGASMRESTEDRAGETVRRRRKRPGICSV